MLISMQFCTERLLLREFNANDLEDKFAFESDPIVVKYVCYGPYSREECRQDLEFHIAHQSASPRRYYHLGLVLPATNRLIGWCGLELKAENKREGEIGYALNRNYWGNGYMFEAAQAVLTFGFEQLKLHRIFATCHPANHASIRVLEKLNMRYEGRLPEQKKCRGEWRDTLIYALRDKV
jgi:RimJ/RimL family protein N-acetyltransferase